MRLKLAAYIASDVETSDDWREKYDYVGNFVQGRAAVRLGDKWGFVNTEGKVVIERKYDFFGGFFEGFGQVVLNGKWGFVNKEGEEVVKVKYDLVDEFWGGDFARVQLKGKWGLVNTKGVEVVPPKYSEKEVSQLKALVDTGEYEGTEEEQYNQAQEEFQIWKEKNKS